MKTQVLQLDPHDDIISTRDKLGWKQTGRILLVWPRKGRVLQRRLDLILLLRHCAALGAQLALVTRDEEVKSNAHALQISVFRSSAQAQRKRWERPLYWRSRLPDAPEHRYSKEELKSLTRLQMPALLHHPAARLTLFSLGVLAVLAIAAVLAPGARIILLPQSSEQKLTLDVRAAQDVSEPNLSGVLPLRQVEVIVEGQDTVQTSGQMEQPDEASTGTVSFKNLTARPLEIPVGLIVLNSNQPPVRFRVTRSGQAPASGEISLPVEALEAGAQGNLPAGVVNAIEGPLGIDLVASNPSAMSGGSLKSVPAPTAADRSNLRRRLLASLQIAALEDYRAAFAASGDLLLSSTPQVVEVLEETYSPAEAAPSGTLELRLRLLVRFPVVSGEDIQTFAAAVLDANLPEGYVSQDETFSLHHDTVPEITSGENAAWQMTISRTIQTHIDTQAPVQLALGLPPEAAARVLLEQLPLAAPPEIMLAPGWWPRLPFLPFRIEVEPGR